MSIKLYGLSVSNFYNIAKMGLLEKGIPFEEVAYSPQEKTEEFLTMSPAGKIPFMEVDGVFLSESRAILRYLDIQYPEPSLIPKDALDAARAVQIHQYLDLYVDGNARRLLGAAFFGRLATDEETEAAESDLASAIEALRKIADFDAYVAGSQFSHADIAAVLHLDLAGQIMNALGRKNPIDALSGFASYRERLAKRPAFAKTLADRQAAFQAMMAQP